MTDSAFTLPDEARDVIWRIFGAGTYPLSDGRTYELIEPILAEHVLQDRSATIAEVQSWYERVDGVWQLKDDAVQRVAALIVDGVEIRSHTRATWAIASINRELAASLIGSRWKPERVEAFVEDAIQALKEICDKDEVIDPTKAGRLMSTDAAVAKLPRDSIEKEGKLATFHHLEHAGHQLVYMGVRPAVARLVTLALDLRPNVFKELIGRLDHPVIQALATVHLRHQGHKANEKGACAWISEHACDALIALAIISTLDQANNMEAGAVPEDGDPHNDEADAPHGLITELVDRLGALDPLCCTRWIGELLGMAPLLVHRGHGDDAPPLLTHLERSCTELLVSLVRKSWSSDLLRALCDRLRLSRHETWPRHMAAVAWALKETSEAHSKEIARQVLDLYEEHLSVGLRQDYFPELRLARLAIS